MVSYFIISSAILSIIVGILILAFPKFLRLAVGLYLIIAGILTLM